MGEVLTFVSREVADVEETWRRFVPSAALQRVDPRTFEFSWTSAAMPGFSIVNYRLAASVQSAIAPDDQMMACRVASRGAWVGTPRGDLNSGLPWLALDGPTTARWQQQADVRAFVFDRAQAEDGARRMTGDDVLLTHHGSRSKRALTELGWKAAPTAMTGCRTNGGVEGATTDAARWRWRTAVRTRTGASSSSRKKT